MNKIRCPHGIRPKGNCDICLQEYRQSSKYREHKREFMKKYYQSHREQILERQRRYHQSPKYKEYLKKYHQSSKYKEYRKNYRHLHNPKVLNPTPAKPTVTGGVHGCNRIGSNEPFTAQGGGAVLETGGGFTIIHMDKITDKKD